MSGVRYAYRKGHTWLYRRNYPEDVAVVLGSQALKQSLKTGDQSTARVRAAEVNARYETLVAEVRRGSREALEGDDRWSPPSRTALARLRATLEHSGPDYSEPEPVPVVTVKESSRAYLLRRQSELRPNGFKSVRHSVELFTSRYGGSTVTELGRAEGREFLELTSGLSPLIGRSPTTRGLGLDALVRWSSDQPDRITQRTRRRIWSQVNHWLDWAVYEGQLEVNPFKTVRFEGRVRPNPYEVPTDDEVRWLLGARDPVLHSVLLVCLLTGMRAGEAVGLLAEDVLDKGPQGRFFHVQPNQLRLLKTESAERQVPVHQDLEPVLDRLPKEGPLFPRLKVNDVTKRFAVLRERLGIDRDQLVFHSTRKWFVTQCERTGVPEHWTASLVGHQSARSENGLTYGIYSAGISDAQKRSIVDQVLLPEPKI